MARKGKVERLDERNVQAVTALVRNKPCATFCVTASTSQETLTLYRLLLCCGSCSTEVEQDLPKHLIEH